MTSHEWIEAYSRAWVDADSDAAAALFTEHASYRWHPLQEPEVGRDGIRKYWQTVTATQSEVEVRFGDPVESGRRVAVEFWTIMRNDGEIVTLSGLMLLRFDSDGRCEELREYWNLEPGSHAPAESWGT
jgi:ketosteroid isomerase-like protein